MRSARAGPIAFDLEVAEVAKVESWMATTKVNMSAVLTQLKSMRVERYVPPVVIFRFRTRLRNIFSH